MPPKLFAQACTKNMSYILKIAIEKKLENNITLHFLQQLLLLLSVNFKLEQLITFYLSIFYISNKLIAPVHFTRTPLLGGGPARHTVISQQRMKTFHKSHHVNLGTTTRNVLHRSFRLNRSCSITNIIDNPNSDYR